MAGYSTRIYDWQDLADETVTELYTETGYFVGDDYIAATAPLGWEEWLEWTGNGTTINGSTGFNNIVHTTAVKDFGEIKDFYMSAQIQSNGTNSIVVKVSDDNVTYTDVNPETNPELLKGRYVKLQVTVVNASVTASLSSVTAQFLFDPIAEAFPQFSILSSGNTTLPIAQNYSRITSMSYDAPKSVQVVLIDRTATAPKVVAYDMNTWGRVQTATTADIAILGFPSMTVNANGNIEIG